LSGGQQIHISLSPIPLSLRVLFREVKKDGLGIPAIRLKTPK